ncbi:hypothetical protein BDV28DRAFT_77607 [Aspergillus coremiiformis]|uniref:Uncharacterized protein n=1 Tax=Aspergillus coremiiformis TaxID=138285 RepID=A0A5N6YTP5_9EURO|nr:hypothetical protein BDV28DRAFT_77607 [Aspergillus coremiiformis]
MNNGNPIQCSLSLRWSVRSINFFHSLEASYGSARFPGSLRPTIKSTPVPKISVFLTHFFLTTTTVAFLSAEWLVMYSVHDFRHENRQI